MQKRQALFLNFDMKAQPDEVTCGPTCLHALYRYYNYDIALKDVIHEVKQLKTGGTLAVMLGTHALQLGFKASIYTYNLHVFDPTWFKLTRSKMIEKLKHQMRYKFKTKKLKVVSRAYIRFLQAGGNILNSELDETLLKTYLARSIPVLTGLSATYLYGTPREMPLTNKFDSIRGEPAGHFVVINGYDETKGCVYVADPMNPNPLKSQYYSVGFQRLINSILLGILTYDANVLIIEPRKQSNAATSQPSQASVL